MAQTAQVLPDSFCEDARTVQVTELEILPEALATRLDGPEPHPQHHPNPPPNNPPNHPTPPAPDNPGYIVADTPHPT